MAGKISRQTFLKRVKDTVDQYNMLRKGEKVLVAVSGGADSVCLLASLLALRKRLGIKVEAAHLDHCLRGVESENDSVFVKGLCGRLGVEFYSEKIDVRGTGKKDLSLEENARDLRYRFLLNTAEKACCQAIATGHTLDDQAESVLLKVIHGGSISGLSGISPVREQGKIRIVRPLIRSARNDILDFLGKEGLDFVEDSSNSDVRFLRNRVRLEVIPYLEGLNPKIKRSLANTADGLREDLEVIKFARGESRYNKNAVSISELLRQPAAVRKQLFREMFERAGGNVKKLTYRHWMDVDRFVRRSDKGKSLDLPGGVRASKRDNCVIFSKYRKDS